MSLIMIVLIFLSKKEFDKIEVKNNICVNRFGYEDRLVFPIRVSDKKVWKLDRFAPTRLQDLVATS